jgi:indolepyruvate ferredoxin oxidoreductase
MADIPSRLNQVRIDTQQADALLACDLVVGASPEALVTVRHGRTRILANAHEVPVAESLRNPDADLHVPELLDKLRFAAGAERVETLDAQSLAEAFLGDAIVSNILALGYAWQRGLVPVGLEALLRAIELNGVAVDNNKLAFSLGRLAAGQPEAVAELLAAPSVIPAEAGIQGFHGVAHNALDSRLRENDEPSLDAIVTRGMAHLTAYQDAAYAKQFANFVAKVRTREQSLGADASLPFTRAVAASLLKLMAYKDEYEVARLYTDGEFRRSLAQQFEGEVQLEFYMAPPVLSRGRAGQAPRKVRLGGWMLPAMKLLARGRRLRGTAFDLFGRTQERRMERELIAQYRARIDALLPALAPERLKLATDIAALPLSMRGFGHVKLANVALARAREAELLHRFDPATYAQPDRAPRAGQLRGIAVTAQAT